MCVCMSHVCVFLCVCVLLVWGEVSNRKGRPGPGQMITNRFVFVFVKEEADCYGLHVCASPKSHVGILKPKVMVLESGAFGR